MPCIPGFPEFVEQLHAVRHPDIRRSYLPVFPNDHRVPSAHVHHASTTHGHVVRLGISKVSVFNSLFMCWIYIFFQQTWICIRILYHLWHRNFTCWFTRWDSLRWHQVTSLTHWGQVTHICVSKLATSASDNGLSPGRRQAIIWTNAGILLIRPLGTNFSEFLVEILIFSFKKMHLKVSSAKRRPFCLGLSELTQ